MTRDRSVGLVAVRSALENVTFALSHFRKRRRYIRVPMPSRHDQVIDRATTTIHRVVTHELLVVRSRVSSKLSQHAFKFAKRAVDETMGEQAVRDFIGALDAGDLAWSQDARNELRDLLRIIAEERAGESIESLAAYLGDADMAAMVTQANERAVAWAEERVGNLITAVTDTTRDAINEMSARAIDAGWTNRQLAAELEQAWEFSPERALMIARTEPTFAESAGTLQGYETSGVVEGKGWSAEDPCEICQGNVDDGIVGLNEEFSSGDTAPPAHPFCKCAVYAAVALDA